MSLRMRLTWALVAAALGPLLIGAAAILLRAENQAGREAQARLAASERQTRILVERHRDATQDALDQAANDLTQDYFALEALRGRIAGGGRNADPGTLDTADRLAQRRGLDALEILDGEGRILADSQMDARIGLVSGLAALPESGVRVEL